MNPSQANHAAPDADEQALLARLRAGETAAFEQLIRAYGGRLLAVARRFLPAEEDARDAVQEAFTSAFRSIGRFEGNARLSTWLHRIAVNAALMKLRTRRRKPEESIEDLLPRFLEDGHPVRPAVAWRELSDELIGQKETRALVQAGIDRLLYLKEAPPGLCEGNDFVKADVQPYVDQLAAAGFEITFGGIDPRRGVSASDPRRGYASERV